MPIQHFTALGQEGEKTTCITQLLQEASLFPPTTLSLSFLRNVVGCFLSKTLKRKKKLEGMFLCLAKVKYDLIMDRPNE